jgi:hypothetical protein
MAAEGEDAELTIEQRLDAAEKQLSALESHVSEHTWVLIGLAVAMTVAGILFTIFTYNPPAPGPSNHDAGLTQLLSLGVHCYDSAEERASARQRALAALDRMHWQQEHPEPTGPPEPYSMIPSNTPPPPKIPVIDDTPAGKSWDGSRCFEIRLPL